MTDQEMDAMQRRAGAQLEDTIALVEEIRVLRAGLTELRAGIAELRNHISLLRATIARTGNTPPPPPEIDC